MRSVLAFFVIALALTVPSAYAGPSVKYGNNGGTLYPGPLNEIGTGYRSVSLDDVTNATILRDVVDTTVGGQSVSMSVRRAVPLSGALRLGARLLPYGSAALTAYDLFTAAGCRYSSGKIACDMGTPPDTGIRFSAIGVPGEYVSRDAACAAARSHYGWHSSVIDDRGYVVYCTEIRANGTWGGSVTIAERVVSSGSACTPLANGRCAGGEVVVMTPDQAADYVLPSVPASKGPSIVSEALSRGVDVSPYASPLPATGPSRVSGQSRETTSSSGERVTETTEYNITYSGDTYTYNITNTTTNNTTNQSSTTTTDQPNPECGVAGKPPCAVKVDEDGTPVWKDRDGSALDALKTAEAAQRDALMGQVPQPDLGWFGAPPLAECTPFEYPNGMGSINPCGVVSNVREVMAYLWALVAAWLSFGMIRKAATGGS